MTTVHAFISSTSRDLRDCRRNAIKAVQRCDGVAITMENWHAPYVQAVPVCRQKIKESSHYIGIFAYRYGWRAPDLDKSITEAEFEWAKDCIGTPYIVAFCPEPTTAFANELRRRAKRQTTDEADRQKAFLARIRSDGGFCEPFDDKVDLAIRVTRAVKSWAGGGIRAAASREQTAEKHDAHPTGTQPGTDDIIQLGRRQHVTAFQESLDTLSNPILPNLACFLIHGPGSFGHREMMQRLRQHLEQNSTTQPLRCAASVAPLWRQNSLSRLLSVFGSDLEDTWVPETPEALAQRLKYILADRDRGRDVLLEISDLQRFEGGLPDFVEGFWTPIVSTLTARTPYRLVVLVTLEQDTPPAWQKLLRPPLTGESDPADFSPKRLIELPALTAFRHNEVANWLRQWIPPEEAWDFAETLIDETQGHPQLLYNELRDEANWIG